jgi:DNA-directed RNA polymerase specialized sigma24 family protein
MERALRYYPCQREELKADALQEALLKIFGLLDKMVDERRLEETEDMVALVVDARPSLTNIYDFGSPFYAFAKRIARNELITQLRIENRQPIYPGALEEIISVLPADPLPPLTEDEHISQEAQIRQLKIDLTRLLGLIEGHLTPKPRKVVCQTLVARPQFWRALAISGLAVPADFPPSSGFSTDLQIAAALGMTENSVRANRSQAKKRIQELDPLLGLLFERLVTPYVGR